MLSGATARMVRASLTVIDSERKLLASLAQLVSTVLMRPPEFLRCASLANIVHLEHNSLQLANQAPTVTLAQVLQQSVKRHTSAVEAMM